MRENDDLFPVLEPRPGGWARIQTRIQARPPAAVWVTAGVLMVAAVVILLMPRPATGLQDPVIAALQGSGVGVTAADPSRVVVEPVPVGDERVVYYRVAVVGEVDGFRQR